MNYEEVKEKYKEYILFQQVYHVSLGLQRITGFPDTLFPKIINDGKKQIFSKKWVFTKNDRDNYIDDFTLVRIEDLKIVDHYEQNLFNSIFK